MYRDVDERDVLDVCRSCPAGSRSNVARETVDDALYPHWITMRTKF